MKYLIIFLFYFTAINARAETGVMIIVNEANSLTEISEDQVADFFLKKTKTWPDGTTLRFFDRDDDSSERQIFLRDYLHKTAREMEIFWIGQKLYTGLSAPTQIKNDMTMAALVSRFPGAIGYVSADFPGGKGVKRIAIKGN